MRRNRFIISSLSVLVACQVFAAGQQMPWPSISTDFTKHSQNPANLIENAYFNQLLNATNRPAWLNRTDITYDIQHNHVPVTGIETIQPLFLDAVNTVFWQGRVSYNSGDGTGNIGLGYRYITNDKMLMWGVNTFYDETFHYNHQRIGLGGEVFTPYVTVRANYYNALSGKKNVGSSGVMTQYERALSGLDAGIETPVPYVSWARFTAQGYHWVGKTKSDINGGTLSFRTFPARQLEVDAGAAYDNSKHTQAFLSLNYYLGSAAFIENSATTVHDSSVFAPQNLENMRLQKVIRHNEIVVEKTAVNTSTGVTIARGN